MKRSFVTVIVPFEPNLAAVVREKLRSPNPKIKEEIDAGAIIHFMSMTVVAGDPGDQAAWRLNRAYLLIEFSSDLAAKPATAKLSASIGLQLSDILEKAGVIVPPAAVAHYLQERSYVIGAGLSFLWRRRTILGIPFDGLPGMSVERIRQEEQLAERIIAAGKPNAAMSALARLTKIREEIWARGDMKGAFEPLQAPFLGPVRPMGSGNLILAKTALALGWPVSLLPAASCLSLIWLQPLAAAGVIALTTLATALLLGLSYAIASRALAKAEASDPVDDTPPDPKTIAAMLERENCTPLNLLVTVSPIKPDWFRTLTLRVVLEWIGWFAATAGRPGFLGPNGEIGTLHAGRWIVLPGTNLLMFIAHYDGSWLNYMQDFVDRQPTAPTAIWTNTAGFPPTQGLIRGGVEDGDRVTRWFHHQQRETDYIYAASPQLTLSRIRGNAAIQRGFATVQTEREAEEWFALFAGRSPVGIPAASQAARLPAPAVPDSSGPDALPAFDSGVPTLAYGTLSHRHFAACLVIRFEQGPAACRAWLARIAPDIAYGPTPRHVAQPCGQQLSLPKAIYALGLSKTGLGKLGISDSDIGTFPASFVDGMASPGRARLLGDKNTKDWDWGNDKFPPDAVVLIYAYDQAGLKAASSNVTAGLDPRQYLSIPCQVRQYGPVVEPFGFRDGLSQPVLPGTGAFTKKPSPGEVVAPGEFVLGYRNETGRLSPTPSVTPQKSQLNRLPPHAAGGLDIGRDSSFLVIRQLQQDKRQFDDYVAGAAAKTGRSPALVAAKILGRWQDGSSLVRHPHKPGGISDNDFRFLEDDPDGLACPKGAHIRRANPRDMLQTVPGTALLNRHRLLRLGRPYVDSMGRPSGTLFMCLNADIERQFELVQQAWVQNTSFSNLRDEADPLTGTASRSFTIPAADGPVCLHGLPQFVIMRGGGYFWMPGKAAVEFMINLETAPATAVPPTAATKFAS